MKPYSITGAPYYVRCKCRSCRCPKRARKPWKSAARREARLLLLLKRGET